LQRHSTEKAQDLVTFSVFDKLNSTFTIWHYKFSIYYKFVIVTDLVYAQHVTEEH